MFFFLKNFLNFSSEPEVFSEAVRSRGNPKAWNCVERMLPDESSEANIFRRGARIQIFVYSGAAEEIKTFLDKSCFCQELELVVWYPAPERRKEEDLGSAESISVVNKLSISWEKVRLQGEAV